jgi:hypothetical protein
MERVKQKSRLGLWVRLPEPMPVAGFGGLILMGALDWTRPPAAKGA